MFYYGVMKSRKHERQTNISMSLPVKLAEEITAAAKSENRSRSNWIVTKLRELLATKK
jgi:metal-responsive CopG/Arc/MetJ family transcriptional regulator